MGFIKQSNGLKDKIMFVNQLSQSEKQSLMSVLVYISKADGNLAEAEIEFLTSYANENEIELDFDDATSIEDACNEIISPKAKIITIQEIVKLAISDGHYDESERAGAIVISKLLQLPLSKFEEIESWVLDGEHWVNRGIKMLAEA